jgi:glutathione S-transferase
MKVVPLEQAREEKGVRLVVAAAIPSPWSEAAKGTFVVKGIDVSLVRLSRADQRAVKEWTAAHNVPVLVVDDEPPRTHWSDILEAAERVGGERSLVPSNPDERARMFGLSHELLGEGGLVWSGRLLAIHRGLTTEGKEGFPVPIARYLASKYGYTPERVPGARDRVLRVLARFAAMLEGREHLIADELSALDIHLATALFPFAQMSEEQCPGVLPMVRHAFATAYPDVQASVPPILVAHRDRIYERYLGLPVEL